MHRYFIEVAYTGNAYAGFQIQQNANTIQAEVQRALLIYYKQNIILTGSSRTDAGVHAKQNYFHFDVEIELLNLQKSAYHLNAILPFDIVINSISKVSNISHCRFNAISRSYQYNIIQHKDPFLFSNSYFYPYPLNINLLNQAANIVAQTENFKSFSKKNTQVFTHNCIIYQSIWVQSNNTFTYLVTGNRFLRGMVRGLVATMLQVGKLKLTLDAFQQIIDSQDAKHTDFSAPAKGLILQNVSFPLSIFI